MKKIINKIQNLFSVTKSELLIVSIVFSGIVIGIFYQNFFDGKSKIEKEIENRNFEKSLDSLAEVNKTTFIGTDIKGNPDSSLVRADTLVKKESLFPVKPKKENPNSKININNASKTQLMSLSGIGDKTALSILEYRNKGKFNSIDEIKNIKGIGQKKFEKIKDYIEVK